MDADGLVAAIREGDSEAVRAALEARPSLARSRDGSGVSVVCLAVYAGEDAVARDPEVALLLVRRLLEAGVSPSVAQQHGMTSLHEAALRGHDDLVRLLLRHGADTGARNEGGETPANLARERGHVDVAALLRGDR